MRAAASAGVQVAAGALGRALATADVEGDGGVLDPMLLEGIGTDLVRAGRFLGLLRVDPLTGKLALLRAGAVASVVYGSADPATWRYSLHMGGPSAAETVRTVAAETVNVRLNADSYRPWEGIAPLTRAAQSGTLYGRLAASLGNEAAVAVLRLIPMPGGSTVNTDALRSRLARGEIPGRLAFPTTTAAGFGAGRSSSPLTDWKALRVGFDGTEAAVKLYALLMTEAAECCGVPAQLVNRDSAGPAAREAWRRFTVGTVEPIARMVEAELSRVLEVPVKLRLRRMGGIDAAGRARALHVLTEAGYTAEQAADLLGWD